MDKKMISVIVPTYMPKMYLWECLDSLCAQSCPSKEYEIIIVLNGERQPFEKQILKYIQSHSEKNIEYFFSSDTGVSNARNIGINVAKGDYIAFIDDDDYVSSSYLEDLISKADSQTMVLSNTVSFLDGSKKYDYAYPLARVYSNLKKKDTISLIDSRSLLNGPCMKIISKDIIQDIRFNPKLRNGEDSVFMFEISKNVKRLVLAPESAIYYRRFREQSATTRKKSIVERLNNTQKLLCAYSNIFFKSPKHYSFKFYILRLLATFKGHLFSR